MEMPVRTWEASWDLEEGWEPRSRSRRGGCPWLQRAPRKRHFLRLWGEAKVKVTIVLWMGWAGQGG